MKRIDFAEYGANPYVIKHFSYESLVHFALQILIFIYCMQKKRLAYS